MTLRQLCRGLTNQIVPPIPVLGVSCHSKQVRPGELFVAVRGKAQDGHQFLEEAVRRGACALIVERPPLGRMTCPVVVVPDSKRALALIASRFYSEPASRLRLIGVTGTNGKTTTTYLLKAILEAAGQRTGLLGTVVYEIGQRHLPSMNTTPGSLELQRLLAQMVDQNLAWCAMEVSSHALDQGRIEGLRFDAAIWTCLGSDHLDYHQTLERYAAAKRRLFTYLRPQGCSVINADDAYGRRLLEEFTRQPVVSYGTEPTDSEIREAGRRPPTEPGTPPPAGSATGVSEGVAGGPTEPGTPPDGGVGDGSAATRSVRPMVSVRTLSCGWEGMDLVIESPWGVIPVRTPLVGRHNVSNIAAASSACLALGIESSAIQEALADFEQVPGRMERIQNETGLLVVVDYAHTADALRLVLLSMRELVRGRLIVVFGCGGDRDQSKRPAMGAAASLLADQVILTSDNPRCEHPLDIIHQIKAGFAPGFREYEVIVDREQAIMTALSMAKADDGVLIAGKGHEAYQVFDHITVPFSDGDVVERYFSHSAKAIAV